MFSTITAIKKKKSIRRLIIELILRTTDPWRVQYQIWHFAEILSNFILQKKMVFIEINEENVTMLENTTSSGFNYYSL